MTTFRKSDTVFAGGEFSPALRARVDLEKYQTGLTKATNCFVLPYGGVSNRAGTELVSYARDGLTVQVPFIANAETNETYSLLFSDRRIMFTRHGAPVLEAAIGGYTVTSVGTMYGTSDTAQFVLTSGARHAYANGDYLVWVQATNTNLHSRMFEVKQVSSQSNSFILVDMRGRAVGMAQIGTGTFELRRRYTVATSYTGAQVRDISYAQDNDVMYLAHGDHPPRKLSRRGDTNWTLADVSFTPGISAPTGVTVSARGVPPGTPEGPARGPFSSYKVSSVSINGEESLPTAVLRVRNDLTIDGRDNVVAWGVGATGNIMHYNVYKSVDTDNAFGFVGSTTDGNFVDRNITPDTSDGPQMGLNPFNTAAKYPRAVTMHEQRLVFAALKDDPQAVLMSQTASLENFGTSAPAKASDAITFRVRSRDRQQIYSLVSTSSGLAMFTSAGEWVVSGGNDGYLTPSNPVVRPQTSRGSRSLAPLSVGDVLLYAQARGGVVREFLYSYEENNFNGPDRTLFARHLFENKRIVSWAYAQSPHSIVWVVLDDGTLLSMTFIREHDIWGWTPHDVGGTVESVVALPEGDEDAVYLTVKRNIGGADYRFHERMASRLVTGKDDWFFVDCGLRYKGAAADTIYGLSHLEGEEVVALADGNVIEGLSITNGRLDLTSYGAASNVVVGLGYTSEIETLDLHLGSVPEIGVVAGRQISIPEVLVTVEHTRGVQVGYDREHLTKWKQRASEPYGAAIEPFTGKFSIDTTPDYNSKGSVVIRQPFPLPVTVLAISPDVAVGG